jgi:cytoskeletal protein CcmA (bactofilin family)
MGASQPVETVRREVAHIGKSVVIKGELSGSEDLYLDGEVQGTIELRGHNLVIGPNGRVRAEINARDVIVEGKVEGNVHGADRVSLRKSAVLAGDITTQRIMIEEGAYFKGRIDVNKDSKADTSAEPKRELAQNAAVPGNPGQGALLDVKK